MVVTWDWLCPDWLIRNLLFSLGNNNECGYVEMWDMIAIRITSNRTPHDTRASIQRDEYLRRHGFRGQPEAGGIKRNYECFLIDKVRSQHVLEVKEEGRILKKITLLVLFISSQIGQKERRNGGERESSMKLEITHRLSTYPHKIKVHSEWTSANLLHPSKKKKSRWQDCDLWQGEWLKQAIIRVEYNNQSQSLVILFLQVLLLPASQRVIICPWLAKYGIEKPNEIVRRVEESHDYNVQP